MLLPLLLQLYELRLATQKSLNLSECEIHAPIAYPRNAELLTTPLTDALKGMRSCLRNSPSSLADKHYTLCTFACQPGI
jgi:hypothetical protein